VGGEAREWKENRSKEPTLQNTIEGGEKDCNKNGGEVAGVGTGRSSFQFVQMKKKSLGKMC